MSVLTNRINEIRSSYVLSPKDEDRFKSVCKALRATPEEIGLEYGASIIVSNLVVINWEAKRQRKANENI